MHETIDSSVYRRLLAVCPGIDKNDRKTYICEPLSEYFTSVADSDINQLHFEIRDEKDENLELNVGAATYIRFKFKQNIDQGKMNTINILRDDKVSKRLYRSNTHTNFKIQLPTRLNHGLATQWTLKLTSLNMPWANINMAREF